MSLLALSALLPSVRCCSRRPAPQRDVRDVRRASGLLLYCSDRCLRQLSASPSTSVLTARLMIADFQRGTSLKQLEHRYRVCRNTVREHVRFWQVTGQLKVSRKGQGKIDDPRWIFAGPRGPANLVRLDVSRMAARDDSEMKTETYQRVIGQAKVQPEPAYRTVASALRPARAARVHLQGPIKPSKSVVWPPARAPALAARPMRPAGVFSWQISSNSSQGRLLACCC